MEANGGLAGEGAGEGEAARRARRKGKGEKGKAKKHKRRKDSRKRKRKRSRSRSRSASSSSSSSSSSSCSSSSASSHRAKRARPSDPGPLVRAFASDFPGSRRDLILALARLDEGAAVQLGAVAEPVRSRLAAIFRALCLAEQGGAWRRPRDAAPLVASLAPFLQPPQQPQQPQHVFAAPPASAPAAMGPALPSPEELAAATRLASQGAAAAEEEAEAKAAAEAGDAFGPRREQDVSAEEREAAARLRALRAREFALRAAEAAAAAAAGGEGAAATRRDEWMTTLPKGRDARNELAALLDMQPRTFKARAGETGGGDASDWTMTPAERARRDEEHRQRAAARLADAAAAPPPKPPPKPRPPPPPAAAAAAESARSLLAQHQAGEAARAAAAAATPTAFHFDREKDFTQHRVLSDKERRRLYAEAAGLGGRFAGPS